MRRAALAWFVMMSVVGVGAAGAASAQEAVQSGWWTSAPVAVAPDAPADGLVIQGGPDAGSPLSFAAISYALAPDAVPESLALKVASGSASTPSASLAACPLTTTTFAPAQGGSASSAPKYDCGTKVTASPSADGTGYTFDVARLARDGALAIALVPTASTDRVVLQRPDAGALTMASTTGPSGSSAATDAPLDAGTLDTTAPPLTDLGPLAAPAPIPAASPASESPSAPAAAPTNASPRAGAAFANAPAAAISSKDSSPGRGLVFVGLVLTAALLWLLAGSGSASGEETR